MGLNLNSLKEFLMMLSLHWMSGLVALTVVGYGFPRHHDTPPPQPVTPPPSTLPPYIPPRMAYSPHVGPLERPGGTDPLTLKLVAKGGRGGSGGYDKLLLQLEGGGLRGYPGGTSWWSCKREL